MAIVRAILLFVACASAVPALAQTDDKASVTAFYQEWFGAVSQGPERYASFYAPDGMIMPPGLPPAQGREAIAKWMRESQASARYSTIPSGISVDEMRFLNPDWVVYRSTLRGKRVPKDGSPAAEFETKYVDLLRRLDGKWQVMYRMWSDNR
jgi:uncharacterized protein (TIGR02246 family)